MAVREEFEYISFRCCYCYYLNPARKKRPAAPKLESDINKSPRIKRFSSSDSEKNSELETDSDTDKSKIKKSPVMDACTSDNERTSDFDKLSDLDVKNSDSESPQPMEVDNSIGNGPGNETAEDNLKGVAEEKDQVQTSKED